MRIYIAGPMRGYERYNFPAFDAAERHLREQGHSVLSPAAMDREVGFNEGRDKATPEFIHNAIRRDMQAITTCDAIYLLKGWSRSSGATLELQMAKFLGLRIFYENVPRIIGFAGRLGAGKDTAAQALVDQEWQKVAFSDAVWDIVGAVNPIISIEHECFADIRFSNAVEMHGGLEAAKRQEAELRRLAQRMGTEAGRKILGETVWLDCLERRLDSLPACPGVCLSGVRFDNEAEWIRARGGIVLEVVREDRPGVDPSNGQHASELGIASSLINGHLRNTGSVEQLHAAVRELAC